MEILKFSMRFLFFLGLLISIRAQSFVISGPETVYENDGTLTVTVTRTCTGACPTGEQVVRIIDDGGVATSGADFDDVDEQLTFTQSDISKTFTVSIVDDDKPENCENLFLIVDTINGVSANGNGDREEFFIKDDQSGSTSTSFEITGDFSIDETDSDQTITFTVTRTCTNDNCPCGEQAIELATGGSTATADTDYDSFTDLTVSFLPNDNSKTFDVTIEGDDLPEIDEEFDIYIRNIDGTETTSVNEARETVKIIDDDIECTVIDNNYSVQEDGDTTTSVTITVQREGGYSQGTTCKIISKDDSAESPDDFIAVDETVSFSSDNSATVPQTNTFDITIKNDNEYENPETLDLCVYEVDGTAVPEGDRLNVDVEILDDDAEIEFDTVAYNVLEGDTCVCDSTKKGVCVKLTRTGYLDRQANVELSTENTGFASGDQPATNDDDFRPLSSYPITFETGEDEKEKCIEIEDDKDYEFDELFRVVLENADGKEDIEPTLTGGGFDKSRTVVTIRNNDADICIDMSEPYEVLEGDGQVIIYFKREGYLDREATITVETADGSAKEDENDYEPLEEETSEVTFKVGEAKTSIRVEIDDTDYDYEDSNEQFRVQIPSNQAEDIGSASGGPSTDIGNCGYVNVTIKDDDAKISIKDYNTGYSIDESDEVTLQFERIGYLDREQTFIVTTFDINEDNQIYQAESGSNCQRTNPDCDFEELDGILVTFPSGHDETSAMITVNDDIFREGDENFGVEIDQDPDNPECIDNDKDDTTVTIEDNDAVIFLKDSRRDEIEEYREYEYNDHVTLILCREGDLSRAQTVYVETEEIDELEGRATAGDDFADRAGERVQFEVGEEEARVDIMLVNDEIVEPVETFTASIYSDYEHIDETRRETVITIIDDDAKCTIQAPSPYKIDESRGTDDRNEETAVCFTVWRRGYVGREGTCEAKTLGSESAVAALNLARNGEHIATSSNDFYATSKTITFEEDEESVNDEFCVSIREDDVCEQSENIYAVIDNPAGTFDKFTQSAYVTILDNEPERFLFLQPFVFDVNESTGYILIPVYRCGDISKEGKCVLRFESGSATGNTKRRKRQDFEPPVPEDRVLVFPPGVSKIEANVTIIDDDLVEGLEGFNIYLEEITGGVIAGSITATVNILDDDSLYSIEFPFYHVREDEHLTVKILRNSNYLGSPGSVDISTRALIEAVGGDVASDTDGVDFELLTNHTVTFEAFQDHEYVTIPIHNDAVSEFSEIFHIYLSNPDGGVNVDLDSASVTILDDDAVYYQFEEVEYSVTETAGTVIVRLERFGSLEEEGAVRIEFRSATDQGLDTAEQPSDFVAADTWVYFPEGDHTAETTFRIINDNEREELETFGMFLTDTENAGEYLYSPKDDATVRITDDDDYPLITYSMRDTSLSVDESESFVEVYVVRVSSTSYLPAGRAHIAIEERANSATQNQDFAVDDLTAYFGDGDIEAKVQINILDSPDIEPTEIFTAVLDSVEGGNANIGFPSRTDITIFDHSVVFNFENTAFSVSESQRSVVIKIQRSGNTDSSASVGLVSVSGSATDTEDYDTVNARVTFDRNDQEENFAIYVNIDDDIEGSETFTLRLVDPSDGAVIGSRNLVTITILDSTFRPPTEPPPDRSVCYSFGESTYNIDEDDGKVYFTVTRHGPGTDEAGRVRFYTNSGSASPGQDYRTKETVLFFDPHHTSQTVYVDILDYDGDEDQEFFTVHLTDPEGADASLCDITVATVNIKDVKYKDVLTLGIIIAIAVAGIILLLLLMAFLICICFRPRPREREEVFLMRRPKPQPLLPQPQPQPQPVFLVEPEPEPEPEEVVRVIRRVRVPVPVGGPGSVYGPPLPPPGVGYGPDYGPTLPPPPYGQPGIPPGASLRRGY